jgi:hypothetical protein
MRSPIVSWALRVGTAAALGIDAAVHAYNAQGYDELRGIITQAHLFRIEAGVACAVALLAPVCPAGAARAPQAPGMERLIPLGGDT